MHSRRTFLTSAGAVLGAAALPSKMWALSLAERGAGGQNGSPNVPLLLGVDYYPDQTPESLWEEDARMMADFGARTNYITRETSRIVAGLQGKLDTPLATVNWNASLNYGTTQSHFAAGGTQITGNFEAALDSVIDPASGKPA